MIIKIIDDYYVARDVSIKMVMLKEFSNDLQTIIDLYGNEAEKYILEENNKSSYIDEFGLDEVNFDV